MKKNLFILKLGGSVVTRKNKETLSVRRALLATIARELKKFREHSDHDIILIHGAGAIGHRLAHEYGLRTGTGKDARKWHGAILSRLANQTLNARVAKTLIEEGVPVTPVHTSSVTGNRNGKLSRCFLAPIVHALRSGCVPLLYGDMVFDDALGMSICSGDTIAARLAARMGAQKVFFATDVDGIFTKDPHKYRDATLVKKIRLRELLHGENIRLASSHNIDVTGGIRGKIGAFENLNARHLEEIVIFNGLDSCLYKNHLFGKKARGTIIKIS